MIYATLSVNVTRISPATAPVQPFLIYEGVSLNKLNYYEQILINYNNGKCPAVFSYTDMLHKGYAASI